MGEQAIAPLRTFGTVLVDQMQSSYELIHSSDAFTPKGRHYLQTQSLDAQTETIEALIEQGLPLLHFQRLSITFMEPQAGRCVRDCFALRQDHLMVELIAAWGATGRRAAVYPMGTEPLTGTSTLCFQRGYITSDEQEQERVRLASGRTMSDCSILSRNTIQMMCFDRRSDISHPFAHTVRL